MGGVTGADELTCSTLDIGGGGAGSVFGPDDTTDDTTDDGAGGAAGTALGGAIGTVGSTASDAPQ